METSIARFFMFLINFNDQISPVILSAAKNLQVATHSMCGFFAALRMTGPILIVDVHQVNDTKFV
jgi:hypothetical protein